MKVTKTQLRQIIKEELKAVLKERSFDWESMEGREFEINHNLFVGFMEEHYPDVMSLPPPRHRGRFVGFKWPAGVPKQVNRDYKWNFPHDVDPEMDCRNKLLYLDKLASSFLRHPYYYDTQGAPAPPPLAEVLEGGRSPYQACLLDLRARRAAYDELRDVEGRLPRRKRRAWEKIRLPGEKK